MTLTLTVDAEAWHRHVRSVADAFGDRLIPVVKGNGYGFGRRRLCDAARSFSDLVAVGTVHELDICSGPDAWDDDVLVLTPVLDVGADLDQRAILTVGSSAHLNGIAGRRVVVKLVSAMQRYGGGVDLIDAARAAGADVVAVSIHPPLVGDRIGEITRWVDAVPDELEIWVSHVSTDEFSQLSATDRPGRFRVRSGTGLWHGDKSMLHLGADVIDLRPITAGTPVGYHQRPAASDGTVVMVGAGSAHGVRQLPDGRSPFHFARRRLELAEHPHMHTSMVLVPDGADRPGLGDLVDVQAPLTTVWVDVIDHR